MGILNTIRNLLDTKVENGEFSSIMDKKVSSKMKNMESAAKKELSKGNSFIRIIDISPNLYLACRAAKICVGRTVDNQSVSDRLNFISKIVGMGHESVIEHTNVIALLHISHINNIGDWSELLSNARFLDVCVRGDNILFGGSIRGYLHILRETNQENAYLPYIKEILYQSVEKEFLKSCIDRELLDADKCTYLPNATVDMMPSKMTQFKNEKEKEELENSVKDNYDSISRNIIDPVEEEGKYSDLVYKTDVDNVYADIHEYGFSKLDACKVSRITFVFHDISRSCANQLVRHRNAISQESQRYVTKEYTVDDFVNPIYMQFDEYKGKENTRYSGFSKDNLEDIIEDYDIFGMYNKLRSHTVYKEDARAWLPMNVKTKLMMTFSYWNYAKFLKLRLNKAAQLEIRRVARESADHVFTLADDVSEYALDQDDKIKKFIEEADKFGYEDREVTNIDDSNIVKEEESIKPMDIKTEKNAEKIINLNEDYKRLENE